jgi:hypothetical protein
MADESTRLKNKKGKGRVEKKDQVYKAHGGPHSLIVSADEWRTHEQDGASVESPGELKCFPFLLH